jgi:hypothetical protein
MIPDSIWEAAPELIFGHVAIMNLDHVRQYVRERSARMLNHILHFSQRMEK